jgi:hypothetical protein
LQLQIGARPMDDLLEFVTGRIEELTQKREEYQNDNDYEMDDYLAGAIDAYDIVRIKING